MSLLGRVALVTGATSGIGKGISLALAKEGCHVVVNGFGDPDDVEVVLKEVHEAGKAHNIRAVYDNTNVSDAEAVEAMVDRTVQQFGQLHIVVNNAGIQRVGSADALMPGEWDHVISVNLSAAFYVIHSCLPALRDAGWGRIINISSTHGLVGSPGKSAYVAAKHGILGLTKVIALETALEKITCNAICPGWVNTPLVEAQVQARAMEKGVSYEEEAQTMLSEKHPSQAFTTVEHVGSAVVFLCSSAGENIRGSNLVMDGGWTAI
eukprot:Rmarinus@m.27133